MNLLPWARLFGRSIFCLLLGLIVFAVLEWYLPGRLAEVLALTPTGTMLEGWAWPALGVGNGPGVACSTFAGLLWLLHVRRQCRDRVFFWPFDGWNPPADKHVVAEVYPSLFRNRYPESGLDGDALDAFAVAKWLKDMDGNDFLPRYFDPPLTDEQRELAQLEGWILGVS